MREARVPTQPAGAAIAYRRILRWDSRNITPSTNRKKGLIKRIAHH